MEVDFMAHLALFRNSFLFVMLLSCNSGQQQHKFAESSLATTAGGITTVNNQPFTGSLFLLYPNNDTAFVHQYKNGREHGEWKEFYPGHLLKETRQFANGQKTGRYSAFWPNNSKQLEYHFANDEYNGTCREWIADGTLIKEMHYSGGHEQGSQKVWYNNGKIRSNYTVINGRRYGLLGTKNCRNVSDSIFNNR